MPESSEIKSGPSINELTAKANEAEKSDHFFCHRIV